MLMRMGNTKVVVGGLPDIEPNMTVVDKVVEIDVTDVRYRHRRSAGGRLGAITDGRAVKSVSGDMRGMCLSRNTVVYYMAGINGAR